MAPWPTTVGSTSSGKGAACLQSARTRACLVGHAGVGGDADGSADRPLHPSRADALGNKADHALAEKAEATHALRDPGHANGHAPVCCVTRVLAYSEGKRIALKHILETEMQTLGDGIQAVIVTDFERVVDGLVENVLDDEAGGAIAVFRELLTSKRSTGWIPF